MDDDNAVLQDIAKGAWRTDGTTPPRLFLVPTHIYKQTTENPNALEARLTNCQAANQGLAQTLGDRMAAIRQRVAGDRAALAIVSRGPAALGKGAATFFESAREGRSWGRRTLRHAQSVRASRACRASDTACVPDKAFGARLGVPGTALWSPLTKVRVQVACPMSVSSNPLPSPRQGLLRRGPRRLTQRHAALWLASWLAPVMVGHVNSQTRMSSTFPTRATNCT